MHPHASMQHTLWPVTAFGTQAQCMLRSCHRVGYMYTKFGVDSSSRLSVRVRTFRHTKPQIPLITLPTYRLLREWVNECQILWGVSKKVDINIRTSSLSADLHINTTQKHLWQFGPLVVFIRRPNEAATKLLRKQRVDTADRRLG